MIQYAGLLIMIRKIKKTNRKIRYNKMCGV